jgi:MbtH protein
MMDKNTSNETTYRVLVNHEQQYSLWPTNLPIPAGWSDVCVNGSREQCVEYVERVWTDLRPLSLRQAMASELPRRAEAKHFENEVKAGTDGDRGTAH